MRNFGVIGAHLTHSFSPDYFASKFKQLGLNDCTYLPLEMESIHSIQRVVETNKLNGFNVTIPFKQSIIPYLDSISPEAAAINAVNTVIVKAGQLHGTNTDYMGFANSLSKHLTSHHKNALIFGTGGSSKAIKFVLKSWGIQYILVSRSSQGDFTYDQLTSQLIEEHTIIVNATPRGMYPHVDDCIALPFDALSAKHICYDLIYNPAETQFLKNAKAQQATVISGLEMLTIQADKSWDIWNM